VIYALLLDHRSMANVIPINTPDNWLHFVLGVGMIVLGVLPPAWMPPRRRVHPPCTTGTHPMSSSWAAADRRPRHSAAETVSVGRVASVLRLVMTTLTGKRHNGAATETVALSPAWRWTVRALRGG
jgi:hypothetical protein